MCMFTFMENVWIQIHNINVYIKTAYFITMQNEINPANNSIISLKLKKNISL